MRFGDCKWGMGDGNDRKNATDPEEIKTRMRFRRIRNRNRSYYQKTFYGNFLLSSNFILFSVRFAFIFFFSFDARRLAIAAILDFALLVSIHWCILHAFAFDCPASVCCTVLSVAHTLHPSFNPFVHHDIRFVRSDNSTEGTHTHRERKLFPLFAVWLIVIRFGDFLFYLLFWNCPAAILYFVFFDLYVQFHSFCISFTFSTAYCANCLCAIFHNTKKTTYNWLVVLAHFVAVHCCHRRYFGNSMLLFMRHTKCISRYFCFL